MKPVVYREMKPGEAPAVCDLVTQVFNQYVAPDYGQEGIDEFFRFANPDALKERMRSGGVVWVAQRVDALVGMLEFFPPDGIAMLFVTVRRQGIAKALLTRAISRARSLDPGLAKLIVHSSPYAVPIYQRMGFRKAGDATTENGITYFPMELLLQRETTRQ